MIGELHDAVIRKSRNTVIINKRGGIRWKT
jgi:hypothetical protein